MNFKKEKQQYAEDQATHEKPWELWQYSLAGEDTLHWHDLHKPLSGRQAANIAGNQLLKK